MIHIILPSKPAKQVRERRPPPKYIILQEGWPPEGFDHEDEAEAYVFAVGSRMAQPITMIEV